LKKGFRRKSSEALIYAGVGGRTRTGTPSLTADFERYLGVFVAKTSSGTITVKSEVDTSKIKLSDKFNCIN